LILFTSCVLVGFPCPVYARLFTAPLPRLVALHALRLRVAVVILPFCLPPRTNARCTRSYICCPAPDFIYPFALHTFTRCTLWLLLVYLARCTLLLRFPLYYVHREEGHHTTVTPLLITYRYIARLLRVCVRRAFSIPFALVCPRVVAHAAFISLVLLPLVCVWFLHGWFCLPVAPAFYVLLPYCTAARYVTRCVCRGSHCTCCPPCHDRILLRLRLVG